MSNKMEIKAVLKKLMRQLGVSALEIAEATGMSPQPIYSILNGKTKKPRNKTVKALADFFGVKPSQLIGEEPLISNDGAEIYGFDYAIDIIDGLLQQGTYKKEVEEKSTEADLEKHRKIFDKYIRDEILILPIGKLEMLRQDTLNKLLSVIYEFDIRNKVRVLKEAAGPRGDTEKQ